MRTRLLALLGAAAIATACDDGGTSAEDTTGDAGLPDGGSGDAAPPFNYIPLNDDACELEEAAPAVAAGAERVLAALAAQPTYVGEGLEVCSEVPKNGCPACAGADNPMGRLLADTDRMLGDYVAEITDEVDLRDGLVAYFQRALAYPYRYLVVTVSDCGAPGAGVCPPGSRVRVALTQGKRQPCTGGGACNHFSLEGESLASTCDAVPMTLFGAAPSDAGGRRGYEARLFEDARDDVTFGFIVPLTNALPADPESLSGAALEAWLDELETLENRMDVRLSDPVVKVSLAADGSGGCGTLSGLVPRTLFDKYFADEAPQLMQVFSNTIVPRYVDPENPDFIRAVLSFRLDPGTFVSGAACRPSSCAQPATSCEGNTLKTRSPNEACTLPRPAGYRSGAPIAPSCAPGAPIDWSIDCAAAGGACQADACTTEWFTPQPGEVVFSELFAEPGEGGEEWFELTSTAGFPVDLSGCQLSGREGLIGEKVTFRTAGPLVVAPGGAVVVATTLDAGLPGGVRAAYAKGDDLSLAGSAGDEDVLQLFCGGQLVDEVRWHADAFGFQDGRALQLDPARTDAAGNDDAASWCVSPANAGAGSPGQPNPACP